MFQDRCQVALLQYSSDTDKEANLKKALNLAESAVFQEAQFILLPEVFNCRFSESGFDAVSVAEPLDGESVQQIRTFAQTHQVVVLIGSMIEIDADGHVYNTSVLIGDNGKILGNYRKLHLFDALLDEKAIQESKNFKAGDTPHSVTMGAFKVGLSICYDLRFPELFRHYSDEGVDLLCVPSSFTTPTGKDHWEVLLRARAIENQSYVLAPNQIGIGAGGVPTFGNSMVIDPWGQVMARGSEDQEELVMATIDKAEVDRVRRVLPALEHRRL